ncbi:MAG: NAD(P)H-dependent oxidoreductase [Verrucomicrobiota bacterium]
MSKPKIIAFGGSLRAGSYNQKIAAIAAEGARAAGAEVNVIALRDFPMPIYDQDIEDDDGMPEKAAEFKKLLGDADGFLIASPEYNSGYTGALKNAIDWASRATSDDEPPLSVFKGKTAAILSASPGGRGGARSLAQFRTLLENIHVTVLEDQVTVPKVNEKIDANGNFSDAGLVAEIRGLGAKLTAALTK